MWGEEKRECVCSVVVGGYRGEGKKKKGTGSGSGIRIKKGGAMMNIGIEMNGGCRDKK